MVCLFWGRGERYLAGRERLQGNCCGKCLLLPMLPLQQHFFGQSMEKAIEKGQLAVCARISACPVNFLILESLGQFDKYPPWLQGHASGFPFGIRKTSLFFLQIMLGKRH